MSTKWWVRFSIAMVLVICSIIFVIPTVFNISEDSAYPVKSKISLGLDLQGGLYLVLGIDFKKVYRDEVTNLVRKAQEYLKEEGLATRVGDLVVEDEFDPRRQLIVENPERITEVEEKIKEFYANRFVRLTNKDGLVLEYGMHRTRRTEIEEESVTKSIEVIRNRIDEFGVTEPEIMSQGSDRIVVQLPGVSDIERAKDLIGQTARLEFKMVQDEVAPATIQGWINKAETEGEVKYDRADGKFSEYLYNLNQYLKEELPEDYLIAFERKTNPEGEVITMIPYLVERESQLTGDDLQDASTQIDPQTQNPYVSLVFKSRGAQRFAELTENNVGRRMAIVLDGNIYTAPNIQERIAGGRAQITLGSTGSFQDRMKEASDISLVLRAGALPVELEFQEQRIVGPQLGEDSIIAAEKAALYGIIILFLFILFYYRFSGALALTGLSFNVLFILAALVGFEATLTLPGIAGIALTVGMAIDASVIIFERIREEWRKGLSPYKAVENGFSTAFWTILDANITTALAGLMLLNFGTGPVRGFAVTLLIGIVATVYTSYFIGKLLFEWYMNRVEGKKLSI